MQSVNVQYFSIVFTVHVQQYLLFMQRLVDCRLLSWLSFHADSDRTSPIFYDLLVL